MMSRLLKWITALLVTPLVLAAIFIAVFGWNWLRGPIERLALEKSGRVLAINGDLTIRFGWPRPRIHAAAVTFENPDWAREKQMVSADAVEISVDLLQLLGKNIVFPEVRLTRPVVFLEQGSDGRRNWLLDTRQQDEGAAIRIKRLTLDHGLLGYDDAVQKTHIRVDLSTTDMQPADAGLTFSAQGQYKGLPFKARGSGGPMLAIRDEETPYPLIVDASVGHTRIRMEGTITSLLSFSAIDTHLVLSGDSLDQLFPLIGIALPATGRYETNGHLLHGGSSWRYEKFTGRIGNSDIAGRVQVRTGGKRPALSADLVSNVLDVADLGPLIGARTGSVRAARKAAPAATQTTVPIPAAAHVLPDLPFDAERWNSVDAEVTLKARTIRRAKELPIENLDTHLRLHDSVLTLDPLNFGLAGGQLNTVVSLDGGKDPIAAHAIVRAKNLFIARLFPTVELNKNSVGQINGEVDIAGDGNSVRQMLADANGKAGLVVSGGEISKLMMEKIGLHLWEMLQLKLSGDKLIKIRCGVADFDVKDGVMQTDALIFDTQVTTIIATGSIDLGQEKLDLTLNQKTKDTSPLALRSPIYVRGTFAKPYAEVDKTRVAARGLGAIGLGVLNPFLTLIPLIDAGPGKDSDCRQLVRDAGVEAKQAGQRK